jgi:hypothetical protein
VKNTSTDEGDKTEKVYKYDDWDGFSDSIMTLSSACYWCHPTSGCSWHLYANPHMCMMIIQWASHSLTSQLRGKLGGSC